MRKRDLPNQRKAGRLTQATANQSDSGMPAYDETEMCVHPMVTGGGALQTGAGPVLPVLAGLWLPTGEHLTQLGARIKESIVHVAGTEEYNVALRSKQN